MADVSHRYSPQQIDAVRENVSLVDVITAGGVTLTKRGHEYKGLCPFHNEKSGSFTVNPIKRFYHCFGCQANGTVIDFVMRHHRVSFPEAMKRLSGDAQLDDPAAVERTAKRRRESDRKIAEQDAREETVKRKRERGIFDRARVEPYNGRPAVWFKARGYEFNTRTRPWPLDVRDGGVMKYLDSDDKQSGTSWPTIISGMRRYDPATGKSPIIAVHRTYLSKDGASKASVDKARKIFKKYKGAAIRLTSPPEQRGDLKHLCLAEGIETAMGCLFSGADLDGVWAAGFLENLCAIVVPPSVELITIALDNDSKDPGHVTRVLNNARTFYGAQNITIKIANPPKGMDMDDLYRAEGEE